MLKKTNKLSALLLSLVMLFSLIPGVSLTASAVGAGAVPVADEDITEIYGNAVFFTGVEGQEYIIVPKGTLPTEDDWLWGNGKTIPNAESKVMFYDLTPATEYEIYTRVEGTDTAPAGMPVKTEVMTVLEGFGIGSEGFGGGLVGETFFLDPDPKSDELTYQWYTYEEEIEFGETPAEITPIPEATGLTYTLKAEDVGKYFGAKAFKNEKEVGALFMNDLVRFGTVSFDSKGGSDIASLSGLTYGAKIEKPADSTREGFAFDGWYMEEEYETPWNFDEDAADFPEIILYAKWTPNNYTITSETGLTGTNKDQWTKGGDEGIVITVKLPGEDDSFEHFVGVRLDGKDLEKDVDFTVKKGSTIVTLSPAVLEKLSDGEHTVTVLFDNGEVNTALTVLAASSGDAVSPQTGDNSHIGMWITFMLISLCGLAATILSGRKKRVCDR